MITELLAMLPHELRSFGRGCRRIGSKPSVLLCEQAPERGPRHGPHELRSFSRGCRRIGPKLSMIFREQAPENQLNFVPAWLVVFAEMV